MTYTHPVWNQKDAAAASEALARYAPTPEARAAKAPTDRERAYLSAVDVLWDDVVEANVRADGVTDRNLAARNLPPTFCGHYNEWLMYGYQQHGRYADAGALLMGCFAQAHDERLPDRMRRAAAGSYAYMRSLNLADTRDWDGTAATSEVDGSGGPMFVQLSQAWGSGVAALYRGDRSTAEKHYAFAAG